VLLGLLVLIQNPAARAQTNTAPGSFSGPFSIAWDWSFAGNAVPGQNITLYFNLYNSDPQYPNDTLRSFVVVMPWGNYSDSSLPQKLNLGYDYYNYLNVTIPQNYQPGQLDFALAFSGNYSDGSAFCADRPGSICVEIGSLVVIPDPSALQAQVDSLTTQVASLKTQVSNLTSEVALDQSQVSSLNSQVLSLTAQLTMANDNVTSTRASLATAQASLSSADANLASTQAQLNSANTMLSSEEAQLASAQSSLSTADDVYLPVAAVIPAIVAALFAFLYIRKKPATDPKPS
jgi:hypothetical protein